ncbi:MAG: GGDEF domain-containing protein [Lachnospiraceae bacterium]|nr:GGDEF domain-containing protein [Lachnospiraceae bacterium]
MKYRIAYFTSDWNYEIVGTTLRGLKKYTEDHEDVSLCVFDCFGKFENTVVNRTEFDIINLPNLRQFNGVLIQANQIVNDNARDQLKKRIEEAKLPAVSIEVPMEGCVCLGTDNYSAMREMVEHLLDVHFVSRLAFVEGLEGNPEADNRKKAFSDVCSERGIKTEDIRYFKGGWMQEDGRAVGHEVLKTPSNLPDAIVCANDEMAFGVMEVLQASGINIPNDVIVTGFDDITSSALYQPRLTTLSRDYALIAYHGMDKLISMIEGNEEPDESDSAYHCVFSESCGCRSGAEEEFSMIKSRFFRTNRFMKDYYMIQEKLVASLFESDRLPDIMNTVERNYEVFGCDNIYLCINDFYFDNYEKSTWRNRARTFSDHMILAAEGTPLRRPDTNHVYSRFPTDELLPEKILERERFMVFYPLHYNTYSIGFIALNGVSPAAEANLLESTFTFFDIAIENVRKKYIMKSLNGMLDSLYVRDSLTGLYNRFGLERYGKQMYDRIVRRGQQAQFFFIDMDNMKLINDVYGHEVGDEAIRTVAELLAGICGNDGFLMRFGGDEFLIIADEGVSNMRFAIEKGVRDINDEGRHSFELSLSVGEYRTDGITRRSLEECITAADEKMYEVKKQKKCGR